MITKEMLEKRLGELRDAQKALAEKLRMFNDAAAKTKADFEATNGAIQQTMEFIAMINDNDVQQNASEKSEVVVGMGGEGDKPSPFSFPDDAEKKGK
jgi:hypothetical protein